MNIITIAEHSFCPDLLNENSSILDIGCRGMQFIDHFKDKYCDIFAVDIEKVSNENYFYKLAITNYNGLCAIEKSNDPQATRIIKQTPDSNKLVPCHTLETFSGYVGILFWDLIKLDVEGEEYNIIMSLDKAPAKQLSIEFHLHTGIYGQKEMQLMIDKLERLCYETVQHELTSEHGAGYNYWNSLFVLKS